jgi:hypothetical protein
VRSKAEDCRNKAEECRVKSNLMRPESMRRESIELALMWDVPAPMRTIFEEIRLRFSLPQSP